MESVFELRTVYVSNIFGIVLVAVLLAGNIWRFREKGTENAFLQLILFFAFCGCILDPIAYTADGHPGPLARIVVYGSNALLYLTDMFGTFFWLLFLAEHLNARFSKRGEVNLNGIQVEARRDILWLGRCFEIFHPTERLVVFRNNLAATAFEKVKLLQLGIPERRLHIAEIDEFPILDLDIGKDVLRKHHHGDRGHRDRHIHSLFPGFDLPGSPVLIVEADADIAALSGDFIRAHFPPVEKIADLYPKGEFR